ncbi:MAG TPA: 2-oxoacid:acceptor oxidoreductase family protein, partial [Thermoanaerobaculaceae bacterium]|nr:2-oxoacid:acceptor oxidoreductase family protein [Thermoanaerobaculaceae bacterium]
QSFAQSLRCRRGAGGGQRDRQEAGTPKAANMVALGAYLGATGNADLAVVREVLADTFASRPKLIGLNQTCLDRGYEIGKACAAQAGS